MFLFDGAAVKINIYEGIQFVQHDIYIVRTDAGGYDGQSFGADKTRMGHEFPVIALHFHPVEMPADERYPVRVAHGDNGGGKFLRTYVQVINSAAMIDNQLRFRDTLHKNVSLVVVKYPTNILLLHTPFERRLWCWVKWGEIKGPVAERLGK